MCVVTAILSGAWAGKVVDWISVGAWNAFGLASGLFWCPCGDMLKAEALGDGSLIAAGVWPRLWVEANKLEPAEV